MVKLSLIHLRILLRLRRLTRSRAADGDGEWEVEYGNGGYRMRRLDRIN